MLQAEMLFPKSFWEAAQDVLEGSPSLTGRGSLVFPPNQTPNTLAGKTFSFFSMELNGSEPKIIGVSIEADAAQT